MANNYLNEYLFKNRSLVSSESSDQYHTMLGGTIENIPNGGFPPLYALKTGTKVDDESKQVKREYVGRKSSVSVKSIMYKRRHVTPFIPVGSVLSEDADESTISTVDITDIKY